LSTDGWPAGYDRLVLDTVDSTLSEAARRADSATGPLWILARHQSAARGRRGRGWVAPEGNLAATLLLPRPADPPARTALRSFVAALALRDACVAVTGAPDRFALKWPNDVLLDGGKFAGILLESSGHAAGMAYLAIGIGANLAAAPPAAAVEPGAVRPVALSAVTGTPVAPEAFLTHLAVAYAAHEDRFARDGFDPIRAAWLDHAARLGRPVTARLPRESVQGIFETVDHDGNLVLNTADGPRRIPAADVYF
jgi:BirA family biotin operon repressor/biotin-[acetyl-CoA-carboxylase] ligase